MLNSINNLRLVAEFCRTGQRLPEDVADWLAESLQAFLNNRSRSLNEAFGLVNGRGGVPWHIEEGIRRRDAALRELRDRHFGDLSLSAQAREIHTLSTRYAASSWRFDAQREQAPDHYLGTPKELLWLAFKSGGTMPLCTRQLRNILAVRRSSARPATPTVQSILPNIG